jgi:hypothetical protein
LARLDEFHSVKHTARSVGYVGQFMLYFASKVSSRDPARGSDSPVSRPLMMMTRKEMPLRYPHEHEVAIKPAPGRRDSDPGDATYPEKAVSRDACGGRFGLVEGRGAAMVREQSAILAGTSTKTGWLKEGRLGGEGCHWTTGFFRFFSFVFRALLFLSLHDRDGFCLFQTHTHHTTPPGQGCILFLLLWQASTKEWERQTGGGWGHFSCFCCGLPGFLIPPPSLDFTGRL